MMRFAAFLLGASLLAGCQTLTAPETSEDAPGYTIGAERGPDTGPSGGPDTGDGEARCPAPAYQVLVGQPIGEIHTDSLPSPRRIYSTGDMVTMDHRPDRLNIVTGDDGVVVEVKCG